MRVVVFKSNNENKFGKGEVIRNPERKPESKHIITLLFGFWG